MAAGLLEKVGEFYLAPGYSTEFMAVFIARVEAQSAYARRRRVPAAGKNSAGQCTQDGGGRTITGREIPGCVVCGTPSPNPTFVIPSPDWLAFRFMRRRFQLRA